MFIRQNYRIYPNQEQQRFLNQDMGNQRFIWNYMLAKIQDRYNADKKFIFYREMASMLPELKKELDWLKLGNSQGLQQTLKDLEQALKMSFKKTGTKAGFPRFKKKSNNDSVRYPQSCVIVDNKLEVPKLKSDIKIKGKDLPEEFKSCTIMKRPSGKWFVSLVVEVPDVEKIALNEDSRVVGIDLNSKYFVVLDNGQAVKNPKHLLAKEKKLKRYQRSYARKVKGSRNQNKSRIKVARLHEAVANSRKDFVEKLTTDLATNFDILCIEDLNVKAMQKWNGRMVQSAPFGLFRSKLAWKANKLGKHLVVIDRYAPSSKVCSDCGQVHTLSLNERWLSCDCGLEMHRDQNAAINILDIGLRTVGITGRRSDTLQACGDAKVARNDVDSWWVSMKQEDTTSLKFRVEDTRSLDGY